LINYISLIFRTQFRKHYQSPRWDNFWAEKIKKKDSNFGKKSCLW